MVFLTAAMINIRLLRGHFCVHSVGIIMSAEMTTQHQKCRNCEQPATKFLVSVALCEPTELWEVKEISGQSKDLMDKCSTLF